MSSAHSEIAPDFLKSLGKQDDFVSLAFNDRSGASFVKFTWEFKTSEQQFIFQNTRKWFLHPEFLKAHYPQWSSIDLVDYDRIALKPETQEIITGAIFYSSDVRIPSWSKPDAVGLTLYLDGNSINLERIGEVFKAIQKSIPFAADKMVYLFETQKQWMANQLELRKYNGISSTWTGNFLKQDASRVTTYNAAESYGYLRKITQEEFRQGSYTSKDILIFEEVPLDIGPLSGVITQSPLVPNSHIVFRCMNQKIPNLFIPDALRHPLVSANLGKLVRLTAESNGTFNIAVADSAAAEGYFSTRVPQLPAPRADLSNTTIYKLSDGNPSPELALAYGAKGTNFAILDKALSNAGINRSKFSSAMLLPFSFYKAHLDQTTTAKGCAKAEEKCTENGFSCAELLARCNAQAGKTSLNSLIMSLVTPASDLIADGVRRRNTLAFSRFLIAKSPLPADVERSVLSQLRRLYQPATRIRFRSSTNAEDLPGLTGAGLYGSFSGCLGDMDSPVAGKSACMSQFEFERIKRRLSMLQALNSPSLAALTQEFNNSLSDKNDPSDTLRKVYSSLWTERAFLFRDYYRIPHDSIFMGVLLIPSFADEKANGVAIVERKNQIWENSVVAQTEEISVTNPEIPDAVAENFRSYLDARGNLSKPTDYFARSNQTPAAVLSDDQVLSLSKQLQIVQATFEKLMGPGYVRMDVEFKADAEWKIEIKQARPL